MAFYPAGTTLPTCPLFLSPVVRIRPAGPLELPLAAELPAGGAGAAAGAGRGRGLPQAVPPGRAADEGGRLVPGEQARHLVPPPAGERAAPGRRGPRAAVGRRVPSPSPAGLARATQKGEGCLCDEFRLGAQRPRLPPHTLTLIVETDRPGSTAPGQGGFSTSRSSLFPFPFPLLIYLFSLFFLSFSSLASFHFTQHTNTSAHHVPRALPRFRKSAQRVAGTLGKPSLVKSCELLTPQTHSCFPLCRNLLCPHSGQAQPARRTRSTRRGNWGVLRSAAHGHGREPEPRLRARTSPRPAGLCSPQTPHRTFTGPLAHALSDSARAG